MNLNQYMEQGINEFVKTIGRYYLNSPKGIAFLAKTAPEIKKSAIRREKCEERGLHVPPLIIASITSQCNLHCAGCYSRAAGNCSDHASVDLTAAEWEKIFAEASDLGVSFVLLAGGEPLMRRDIISAAAKFKNIVFPIFTNGTMIDGDYKSLFRDNRNLIPVFSLEGGRSLTDGRRGNGAYDTVQNLMEYFKGKKLLAGVSVTVTSENIAEAATNSFVAWLRRNGCGLLFFLEYVPVEPGTEHLMLDRDGIAAMQNTVERLKREFKDMIIVSFPGDEEAMGGCLASGRGFFHINANGGAEPCPFSPHSEINLKTGSIEEALRSGFFRGLREIAASAGHNGGCTLFDHESEVLALLTLNTN